MELEFLSLAIAANTAHGLARPSALELTIGAAELFIYSTMYFLTQNLMFERLDRLKGRILDRSWATSEIAAGLTLLETFVCCIVNEISQTMDHLTQLHLVDQNFFDN